MAGFFPAQGLDLAPKGTWPRLPERSRGKLGPARIQHPEPGLVAGWVPGTGRIGPECFAARAHGPQIAPNGRVTPCDG